LLAHIGLSVSSKKQFNATMPKQAFMAYQRPAITGDKPMATTKTQEPHVAESAPEEPKINAPAIIDSTALSQVMTDDDFFGLDTGMEDITSADVTLPRYVILQGLSPQINPRKDEYVEGAQMGMILNTATGKVHKSIELIFASYQRRNIEWTPRDKPCPVQGLPQVTGGGLYKDYGTDDSILSECVVWEENNSLWTPRGNELVVTGTWYVIDPATLSVGFIAMGKTQFTASKKLLGGIRDEKIMTSKGIVPAPLFYRAWEMNSIIKTSGENSWFVWHHKPSTKISEMSHGRAIIAEVKEIVRTIREGEMTIDVAIGEAAETAGGSRQMSDNSRM